MTREELLGKLKEMFPEGIPDSCNEVMAREDAPFKSYQELRKIMGRSPAYTNRSNWLALTAGEEGGEVVPPKDKLTYSWSLDKSKFGGVGDTIEASITVLTGSAKIFQITDDLSASLIEIGDFDVSNSTITITCIAGEFTETIATLEIIGQDSIDDSWVEAPSKTVRIPVGSETPLDISNWSLTPTVANTKGQTVDLDVMLSGGEPNSIKAAIDSTDSGVLSSVDIGEWIPGNAIPVTIKVTPSDTPIIVPIKLTGTDRNYPSRGSIDFGTKTLEIRTEQYVPLSAEWDINPKTLSVGDVATTSLTILAGSITGSRVSLGGNEDDLVKLSEVSAETGIFTITAVKAPDMEVGDATIDVIMYASDPQDGEIAIGASMQLIVKAKEATK